MFSSNCSNGSISTSCSFICTSSQGSSRPMSSLSKSSLANSYHSFDSNVKLAIEVTTTSTEELNNRRYKLRCNRLQKHIRELIFVNNALNSELNQCLERLTKGSDERRFLLNKILHFQKDVNQEAISSRILQEALSKKQITKYSSLSPISSSSSQRSFSPPVITSCSTTTSTLNPMTCSISSTQTNTLVTSSQSLSTLALSKRRKLSDSQLNSKTVKQSLCASQMNETVVTKKWIQPLSLQNSRSLFPITIGGLTVHSLGEVVFDRISYHSQDYIFPVGFCSSRNYASIKNPKQRCLYTCKISDNGETPKFQIISDDDPNNPLVGKTSDECLSQILKSVCPELLVSTIISPGRMGSAFFGYSNPNIQSLIQNNPNSKKCVNYKWIKFEVSTKSSNDTEEINELSNAILNFDALQAKIK